MYGFPKVQLPGIPLRPIISSICTFRYDLAKFLVRIIQPLINKYTSSLNFVNEISNLRVEGTTTTMARFDVESLFTDVPLAETTQMKTNNITAFEI